MDFSEVKGEEMHNQNNFVDLFRDGFLKKEVLEVFLISHKCESRLHSCDV